jgi:NitT/TauT family transport system substrate-binding protein
MAAQPKPAFYIAVVLVVLALIGFAVYRFTAPQEDQTSTHTHRDGSSASSGEPTRPGTPSLPEDAAKLIVGVQEIPRLGPSGEYKLQGDTIDVEISEWPGYAPLIWANGGLEPNPDSYFAKNHGFKLKIMVSEAEEEGWQRINSGKTAVTVTTVDVLALYGNQLKVEVPVQLDFSRGGDGILTLKNITNINHLKGRRIVVAQHTEAEFFLRFLVQETGIPIKELVGLDDKVDPGRINLLYTKTAEDAAAVFEASVKNGDGLISGAVTWNPFTVDLPKDYPDQIRLLVSNRNLLIIADILLVNAGFAKQHPKIVKGLVEGILVGTEEIRKNPDRTLPIAAQAFKDEDTNKPISLEEMRELMRDVHLSNHAENMLFFSNETGQVGTFNDIYLTALYAYGRDTTTAIQPQKLTNRSYLEELATQPLFQGQRVELGPIKSAERASPLESDPVLTKQIRFQFEPNSTNLDRGDKDNQKALDDLSKLLQRAPGSYLVLRGHMDTSNVATFKAEGQARYARLSKQAVEHSRLRAESVKDVLIKEYKIDPKRIETEGRGWDEPLPGASHDDNRRVEVHWYTLEAKRTPTAAIVVWGPS